MKFLHSADWHIGKVVNNISMLESQEHFLEDLVKILKEEKVEALVIAGDLYDRSLPPTGAVKLLGKYFGKIVNELQIPILAIAGNHDSGERVSFISDIVKYQGLHIEGVLNKNIECVTINDTNFYLLPYFDPAVARKIFDDEEIRNHEDGMKKVVDYINENKDDTKKTVVIAHGYVTSINFDSSKSRDEILKEIEIVESDSQRPLTMGGTEFISGKIFKGFDYVALGHLHEPKRVSANDDSIRYSGSPLKYSISEKSHKNSVSIVEIDDDGVKVKEIPVKPYKDIRVLKGTLESLMDKEHLKTQKTDDYIHFILTDDGELFEPMAQLKAVYENPLSLEREYKRDLKNSSIDIKIEDMNKNKAELFKGFYRNVMNTELSDKRFEILKDIVEEVEGKR